MRTIAALLILTTVFAGVALAEDPPAEKHEYTVALDAGEVAEGMDGIASVLKKHLDGPMQMYYEAKVRRIKVKAVLSWIAVVFLLLCFSLSARHIKEEEVTVWGMVSMVAAVLLIVTTVVAAPYTADYFSADYVAMREIVEMAASFAP